MYGNITVLWDRGRCMYACLHIDDRESGAFPQQRGSSIILGPPGCLPSFTVSHGSVGLRCFKTSTKRTPQNPNTDGFILLEIKRSPCKQPNG